MSEQILRNLASEMLGWPWLEGGRDQKGIDCMGVVLYVQKRLGHDLPDAFSFCGKNVLKTLMFYAEHIEPVEGPSQPGDILYIPGLSCQIDHLGVVLSCYEYISTTSSGGVQISRLPKDSHARFYRVREVGNG